MARKESSSDGGINLDSLMDALTNVVAVLILVLLLVQADVKQKVQQFMDDLPPATPEDIAQSKLLIEELQRKQTVAEARLREKPATPEDIEAENLQIALLENRINDSKQYNVRQEQLLNLVESTRAKLEAEKENTTVIQKEIAEIEGLLDTVKVSKQDAPTVVRLPNARPLPENAIIYDAILYDNRLHFIDSHKIINTIKDEIEKNKENFLHETVKVTGQPDTLIYDPEKIAAHFKNFNWGDTRGQTIDIELNATRQYMSLRITPDLKNGGSPEEELSKPGGEFAKSIPVLRNDRKAVLMFRVHPSAFGTYIASRELIDKVNIPAGWNVTKNPYFRAHIPDLKVKQLAKPPPRSNKPLGFNTELQRIGIGWIRA